MTSAEPLQGGFDRDAFAPLADAEAGSFWFRSRNELILWAIRHYAPDVDDLVEVGCGTGFVLRAITDAFPRARVTGIEPFEEGLAIARTRVPTAEFRCGDVEALRDVAAFDVAGAFDVLEHIPDDDRAIALVAGALRPGGVFVVTVPQHPRLWSTSDVEAHHVRRYVRSALVGQLRVAGFETVLATSFVSLLAPAMLAARVGGGTVGQQMRLPRLLDRALDAVMSGERALIRAGARLPAGGSLLVVARKPLGRGAV